jgi:hypothetical protein
VILYLEGKHPIFSTSAKVAASYAGSRKFEEYFWPPLLRESHWLYIFSKFQKALGVAGERAYQDKRRFFLKVECTVLEFSMTVKGSYYLQSRAREQKGIDNTAS